MQSFRICNCTHNQSAFEGRCRCNYLAFDMNLSCTHTQTETERRTLSYNCFVAVLYFRYL